MDSFDVIVIGGGIAGVSIGYELAAEATVSLLDMEATLAFHTTGRSAATFLEGYGGPPIRALTSASRAFLTDPPDILDASPLTPLPMLYVGRAGRTAVVEQLHRDVAALVGDVTLLTGADLLAAAPRLRPGWAEAGVLEPGASEVDVHALHQGFLRGIRRAHGTVLTSARVVTATRSGPVWTLTDTAGRTFAAPVVVNAAGAWADEVGALFGAAPTGIKALRRSAFTVTAPADSRGEPMIADVDETFYVKPEGAQYLCSPADETPQPPGNAKADELEIARAIDEINQAMTIDIRGIRSSWAGLRNFVADRTPVVGYDPYVDGLFWFAAQGGYGIQTAPALARTGRALLLHQPLPADVVARGLSADHLTPGRLAD